MSNCKILSMIFLRQASYTTVPSVRDWREHLKDAKHCSVLSVQPNIKGGHFKGTVVRIGPSTLVKLGSPESRQNRNTVDSRVISSGIQVLPQVRKMSSVSVYRSIDAAFKLQGVLLAMPLNGNCFARLHLRHHIYILLVIALGPTPPP